MKKQDNQAKATPETETPETSEKAAPTKAEELSLEDSMNELSDIIRTMEDGGMSLEDTFALYKKGLDRLKICHEKLDRVEKELEILEEGGDEE